MQTFKRFTKLNNFSLEPWEQHILLLTRDDLFISKDEKIRFTLIVYKFTRLLPLKTVLDISK